MNERLHALKILTPLLQDKSSLAQLMPNAAVVSPMTKELCFGVCRHYFRLEAMADALLDKRPKSTEVWVAILLGLYQLHYLQQPDYAVVKETVALLEKTKTVWAKGLVNAVLRNFCRKQTELLNQLSSKPEFIHGQPQWLLQRLQTDWPENWQDIAVANDAHPPMTLRINVKKTNRDAYLQQLTQAGITAQAHAVALQGIILKQPCNVQDLPGFAEGLVAVQDAAAQLAADLLDVQAGQRVLDACCAPGGKTCHILETQPNLKECVALDVDAKRLERVQDNLNRLQLKAHLLMGDAMNPSSWWDGQLFERILLDAPCSATGVIRRHADIKLLRTAEDIKTVCVTQKAMLKALWPLLAPGGLLLYATCSVIAAENEQQIATFKQEQADCAVIDIQQEWGRATGHGRQILPGEEQMDGFFYALLRKAN
ncbi:MAG: 16S rRNA (cytosine(967)-C(5))-methyltransferase RsmB [Legionella sp.]|nr:MAG: 16S rRNA (cytosine(967)-C(5))-methyltransferase RsmB [Legionella sp.]